MSERLKKVALAAGLGLGAWELSKCAALFYLGKMRFVDLETSEEGSYRHAEYVKDREGNEVVYIPAGATARLTLGDGRNIYHLYIEDRKNNKIKGLEPSLYVQVNGSEGQNFFDKGDKLFELKNLRGIKVLFRRHWMYINEYMDMEGIKTKQKR